MIRYELLGEAEVLPDVITVEGCGLISGDGCGAGGKYHCFSDVMVNKNGNGIISVGHGEFYDEVHGDCGEQGGISFRENGLKQSQGTIGEVLGRLAGGAAIDVILDKVSHSSPPKGSGEEFVSFEVTGVARAGHVMVEGDNIVTEFWVVGDV